MMDEFELREAAREFILDGVQFNLDTVCFETTYDEADIEPLKSEIQKQTAGLRKIWGLR